jgi:pyruvate/2-oxoglutarate dehydrogenase complex dihydrolipoamide dehydrogenase (E3) component
MAYDYDVLTIGLGPAGMAVSVMAAEMGLRVAAIEKHRIGGECMNVGCIPSKALLRMAKTRNAFRHLERMRLGTVSMPAVLNPFERIQSDIRFINDSKTVKMLEKVDLVLGEGQATFVDAHRVRVGNRTLSARRIFIATGTQPAIPAFPGIETVDVLTNNNIFHLSQVPDSILVIGGGAIAVEMAQAFTRLGSAVTMIIRGPRLLRHGDEEAVQILQQVLQQEGIQILPERQIEKIQPLGSGVQVLTAQGDTLSAEKLLVATGRTMDFSSLGLEKAGVKYSTSGITVNKYLQTSQKHIFAVGDCNGHALFSHAAMHQGMIALINAMLPGPLKRDYRNFVVPWTIFSEPQISHVGPTATELEAQGTQYELIKVKYADYGAAIAEGIDHGFVKVYASPLGKIYAATVVGEGSGDMINEWGLAIQTKRRMHELLFLQHSFPSMAFLNKRIAENWTMNRMRSPLLQSIAQFMYRW